LQDEIARLLLRLEHKKNENLKLKAKLARKENEIAYLTSALDTERMNT